MVPNYSQMMTLLSLSARSIAKLLEKSVVFRKRERDPLRQVIMDLIPHFISIVNIIT